MTIESLFSTPQSTLFTVALAICLILFVIALIVCRRTQARLRKFQAAYVALQTLVSGKDIETLLEENLTRINVLEQQANREKDRLDRIEAKVRQAVDRVEIVRFNSLDTMGAELSYALALLNQEGSGVLMTSIYTVEECRTYAKAIEKGQCKVKLGKEEKLAIEKACQGLVV